MPPRSKGGHAATPSASSSAAEAGPHGGQASIRKAYEALGVQHFYASHGARYTNPHEAQITAALAQLLEAVPAAAWLGLREPQLAGAAAAVNPDADSDGDDGDDSPNDGGNRPSGGGGGAAAVFGGCGGPRAVAVAADDATIKAEAEAGSSAAAAAAAVVSGLVPPVSLRVLDLACGSGEATAALTDWNQAHPLTTSTTSTGSSPCPHAGNAAEQQRRQQQPAKGRGRGRGPHSQSDVALLPYDLRITACDPYTGAAYRQRTGVVALGWSFEDIADGCLADWDPGAEPEAAAPEAPRAAAGPGQARGSRPQGRGPSQQPRGANATAATATAPTDPGGSNSNNKSGGGGTSGSADPLRFDLVVCSFALHLCDASRLYGTLTALSLAARWLAVLAPHKRPVVGLELGWRLVGAWKVERTHVRLYRSLRVPAAAEGGVEGVEGVEGGQGAEG